MEVRFMPLVGREMLAVVMGEGSAVIETEAMSIL